MGNSSFADAILERRTKYVEKSIQGNFLVLACRKRLNEKKNEVKILTEEITLLEEKLQGKSEQENSIEFLNLEKKRNLLNEKKIEVGQLNDEYNEAINSVMYTTIYKLTRGFTST